MAAVFTAILGALIGFLGTYFSREHHWTRRLADAERESKASIDKLHAELDSFRKSVTYYDDIDHLLLLDGPSGAGKSALVAKWTNPGVDVLQIRKTQGLAEVHHYLCAESYLADGFRRERRHRLRHWDVPGERQDDIIAAIDETPPRFLVFVIDPDEVQSSADRYSVYRLKLLYGRRHVLDALLGVLVYVSKCDRHMSDARKSHIERNIIEPVVSVFSQYRVQSHTFFGSAVTGAELSNAMGFIVERLGLRGQFPKHASLT